MADVLLIMRLVRMSVIKNMDLSKKIVIALVFAGFVSVFIVSSVTYILGSKAEIAKLEAQLTGAITTRQKQAQRFQGAVIGDVEFLVSMRDIAPMFDILTNTAEVTDQKLGDGAVYKAYVDESPFPAGERELLDDAEDGSKYSAMHARIHPTLREYLYSRGYYDIFLINTEGKIVYSVYKESDFQQSLVEGELAESGLALAFNEAVGLKEGNYAFSDFDRYGPSGDAFAGFVAMPVYASSGSDLPKVLKGVVAVQLSTERMEGSILAETKASATQSYLIGDDGIARTDITATEANDVGVGQLDISSISTEGIEIFEGAGIVSSESLIGAAPVRFLGRDWLLVTEEPLHLALAGRTLMLQNLLKTTVPVLFLVAIIAWFIGRSLARPVITVDRAMATMKSGNLEVQIPFTDQNDEIGSMARNTDEFRVKLLEASAATERQAQKDTENEEARIKMLSDLEQSVGVVVEAVSKGRFDARVNADFKDEAFKNLGLGVNGICDVVQSFVTEIDSTLGKMAEGDLTVRMKGEYSGRFGEVSTGLNETAEKLSGLVSSIKNTGEEMNSSIRQVADGSADLAKRAEAQAASLEETAATMDKMTSTINLNAKNAFQAEELAADTKDRAVKGHAVVDDAVKAMGEIEESSTQITDIISVIDSIAFQTNLLALNAAVEAARAGDAGKGFAVVASEVRTLAQRSSEAAKDISGLITVSSEKVKDGVELVNATGLALNDITEAVTAFSETISNISNASREQSNGVAEISASVSEMDDMTQHNATLADSSASAAQTLTEFSDEMSKLIEVFKIDELLSKLPKQVKVSETQDPPKTATSQEDEADLEWNRLADLVDETEEFKPHQRVAGEDWADF